VAQDFEDYLARAARAALSFIGRDDQTTDERSPAKCPTMRDNNAKPDGMIDGRESGLSQARGGA
jgi:hypothetical protein